MAKLIVTSCSFVNVSKNDKAVLNLSALDQMVIFFNVFIELTSMYVCNASVQYVDIAEL
jgi:hypothetical protein